MKTSRLDSFPMTPTPLGGSSRMLASNPELRLVNLLLLPGETVSSHSAPVEVVFLVLEGQGKVKVAGEQHEIKKGEIFSCPPDLEREFEANSDIGLSLLVVRAPNL